MTVWLELTGKRVKVEIPAAGLAGADSAVECAVDGRAVAVDARMVEVGVLSLIVEGRQYRCVLDLDGMGTGVWIGGRRYGFSVADPRSLAARRGASTDADGPRQLKAPMPGRVVRLLAAVGDAIEEGQGIVVIEAMKMQNELRSPKTGKLVRLDVAIDDTVGAGAVLAVVE